MALVVPPWALWLSVAVGALLAAKYVVGAFRRSLNAAELAAAMRGFLAARQLDEALELCSAIPESPHLAALRAAVEACAKGPSQGAGDVGYRDAPVLTAERVLAPIRSEFERAFDAMNEPLVTARIAAVVALVPLTCALIVGVTTPGGATPTALAGLALLSLVWTVFSDLRLLAERTWLFDALAPQFEKIARSPGARPSRSVPTGVRVRCEVTEPGQPVYELDVFDSVIKIGTALNAQVRIDAPGVSRMHAIIERDGDKLHVIDLGGPTQTRVNGVAVNKRALNEGDLITIGDVTLRVRLGGA